MSCMLLKDEVYAQVLRTLQWTPSPLVQSRWLIDDILERFGSHISVVDVKTEETGISPDTSTDLAACLVRDWQNANVRAYRFRYQHIPEAAVAGSFLGEAYLEQIAKKAPKMPLAVLSKTLRCIRYQLSEVVRPMDQHRHDQALNQVRGAVDAVNAILVTTLPEYESHPWGEIYIPKRFEEVG